MLGHTMLNVAGNIPESCVTAPWQVWKPAHFTWVYENGCQGPVGLRYLLKGRFGVPIFWGFYLNFPINASSLAVFCSFRSLYT